MDKFDEFDAFNEENLEVLLVKVHDIVEAQFKESGIYYTMADIYEETCILLEKVLTEMDPTSEWEVQMLYESMQDLYEKNSINKE